MKDVSAHKLSLKTMDELLLAVEIFERCELISPLLLAKAKKAVAIAALAHAGQYRANRGELPRDTYVTHPLRNALRLLRYGITDEDVIIAAILHDVVEDAAQRIVEEIAGIEDIVQKNIITYRDLALTYIGDEFGRGVELIVKAVTNPLSVPGMAKDERRHQYAVHVESAIEDLQVLLVKFSDFVDNAVGLYHNTGMSQGARTHLVLKYMPLVPVFRARLTRLDVVMNFPPAGYEAALQHLSKGETELRRMMDEA